MKKVILSSLVATLMTSSVFASSEKVCFGSTKNSDTIGVILSVKIEQDKINISTIDKGADLGSENYYKAKNYPALDKTIQSRDGKIYLTYKGSDSGDWQDIIVADSGLLNRGTTGLLQIRSRGESYSQLVYVCKDAK